MNTFSTANDMSAKKKENLKESMSKVEDSVKETSHNLKEVANDAGVKLREFLVSQSEKATELCNDTEKKIHQSPMKSVLIAAVGGLLLGALLRR